MVLTENAAPEIKTVFIAEEQFDLELVQVFKSDLQYNQTDELPVGFARRNRNASFAQSPACSTFETFRRTMNRSACGETGK
jgi:hypothetical protein